MLKAEILVFCKTWPLYKISGYATAKCVPIYQVVKKICELCLWQIENKITLSEIYFEKSEQQIKNNNNYEKRFRQKFGRS